MLFATLRTKFGHLPTNGIPVYIMGMPNIEHEREVIAANLQRLMDYARDHPHDCTWPASRKALAKYLDEQHERTGATKVVRSTIQRALKGVNAPGVDSLGAIARAYGLQAWHLLIPDLDPENPPVVSVTETERLLWARIHEITALARLLDAPARPGAIGNVNGADNPAPRSRPVKTPSRRSSS